MACHITRPRGTPLRRLVVQLATARHVLDRATTPGTSPLTLQVYRLTITTGSWTSGRDCRPVRDRVAAALGVSTRTVTRHWAILEHVGLLIRTAQGRQCPGTRPNVAATFTAPIPAGLDAEAVDRHLPWAASTLRQDRLSPYLCSGYYSGYLTYQRGFPSRPVDNPSRRRCPDRPANPPVRSTRPDLSRNTSLLRKRTYPSKERETVSGSRPAQPARPTTQRRRIPAPRVDLARGLKRVAPWSWGVPLPVLAQAFARWADAKWTARDVVTMTDAAVQARGFTYPDRFGWGPGFARWALAGVPLDQAPSLVRERADAVRRAEQAARDAAGDRRARNPRPPGLWEPVQAALLGEATPTALPTSSGVAGAVGSAGVPGAGPAADAGGGVAAGAGAAEWVGSVSGVASAPGDGGLGVGREVGPAVGGSAAVGEFGAEVSAVLDGAAGGVVRGTGGVDHGLRVSTRERIERWARRGRLTAPNSSGGQNE